MFKEYGKISAKLYEHTKPVGHSINGDLEYYAEKLKNLSGRVLEAGVGTGRILIPLAKKSITIDGGDISGDMLEQCKANMEQHDIAANLYKQDLTQLSLPHKYDAIIMPTGSFCLLPKLAVHDILGGFYNQLDDGGKLIVDLEMPTDFREGETSTSHFPLSADTGILLTVFNKKIDWFAQKVSSVYRYELLKGGEVIQTELSHFVLHWYGITEFEMLLARSGFKSFEHEIGYGNKQSQIVTFTALKRTTS